MKTVSVAEFKSHLSEHLRATAAGVEIVVTTHGHPVARLTAYRSTPALTIRQASLPVSALRKITGVRPLRTVDPVILLREDRDKR